MAGIKSIGIKKNLLLLSFIRIFTYLIPLITAPYLSRVFGPDGIGEYTYAYSIVSYFSLAVNFGFAGYGVKEIGRLREKKEEYSISFWSIVSTRAMLFALSFTAYCILLLHLKQKGVSFGLYLTLALTIFANLFDITYLFQGLENIRIISIINFGFRIVGLICIFVFVNSKEDLIKYTIIQSSQLLLIAIIPWFFLGNAICLPPKGRIRIKNVAKESLFYFLPTLAVTLCSLIDKTMLGRMSSKTEVGYYEQVDKIIIMVIGVLHSFAEAFASRISYLIHEGREKEAAIKINNMFELYLLLGIPSILGLYAIGSSFITLFYGEAFIPAIGAFYFLIPLIAFKSLSNALGNIYYSPREKMWMTSIFYAVGSLFNIVLNAFLIPRTGAKGAAIASFSSELAITLFFIGFSYTKIQFKEILKKTVKPIIAATIMYLIIRVADNTVFRDISLFYRLIIEVSTGILIYCVTIVCLKEKMVVDELSKMIRRKKQ